MREKNKIREISVKLIFFCDLSIDTFLFKYENYFLDKLYCLIFYFFIVYWKGFNITFRILYTILFLSSTLLLLLTV